SNGRRPRRSGSRRCGASGSGTRRARRGTGSWWRSARRGGSSSRSRACSAGRGRWPRRQRSWG
ncbi:hypothetical protein IWQ56_003331, partial [Coemansia nantahalensis]